MTSLPPKLRALTGEQLLAIIDALREVEDLLVDRYEAASFEPDEDGEREPLPPDTSRFEHPRATRLSAGQGRKSAVRGERQQPVGHRCPIRSW